MAGLFFLASSLPAITLAQPQDALSGVAVIRDNVKNKRISSYDRTGGNGDNVSGINDGEK